MVRADGAARGMRTAVSVVAVAMVAVILWAGCTRTRRPVEGEKVLRHSVAQGETLDEIALDYYGDADRAKEIARFNDIDPDTLAAGDVVRVPMTPGEMHLLHQRELARPPYNDGLALAARGSYVEAVVRFQRAVELDPGFAEAWYNLGLTHQRIDVLERAADEYRKAVKLRPDNADYRYALGNAYYHLERYDDAIATFEKVLRGDRFHRKAQFSLALSFEKSGRPANARRAWERYLEIDGTSEWARQAREHLDALQ